MRTRDGEEVWESAVPGQVWLEITDEKGRSRPVVVRGYGKLRIRAEDREIVQDGVVDPQFDPFTNGSLVRVDQDQGADPRTASPFALDTERLVGIFALPTAGFQEAVDGLNEITVRRMLGMVDAVDAAASQVAYLQAVVRERWPVGGDTPTYRELKGIQPQG